MILHTSSQGIKGPKAFRKTRREPVRIEGLEPRRLFAVSTATWFGPYLETGTKWTLRTTTSGGNTANFAYVNAGTTVYKGLPSVEVNITGPNGITGKTYDTTDNAGNYIQYSSQTTFPNGSEVNDYSPYRVLLPGSLSAGVTVTLSNSNVETENSTSGSETTTFAETYQFTLLSESTTSITVPAGTYAAYQVTMTESAEGSDGSSIDPDTQIVWWAPDVGIVKSVDQESGTISELTTFEGKIRRLGVIQQPTATTFGDEIEPGVQVALQDGAGATVGASNEAVTITASLSSSSTGQGVLSGTTSVATSGGIARFNNLSIDKPGRYVLIFTDSKGRIVGSEPFDVSAGKLEFRRFPSEGVAGSIIRPGVKVALVDGDGKLIKDAPSLVTLTLTGAGIGLPIEGNTAQLVNGIADFETLKLVKAGKYILEATDANGSIAATSTEIEIKGPHLDFKVQPRKVGVNGRIKYGIVLEDPKGRRIFNNIDTIRFTLNVIEGPSNAALLGSTDILTRGAAINDTQPYVAVNAPGTYTLTATLNQGFGSSTDVSAVESITSNPFEVVQNKLVFTRQPANTQPGITLRYEIQLKDYKKKTVISSDQLTFTLMVISDGAGAVLSSNTDSFRNGKAENDGNIPIKINLPGTYKLIVAVVPAIPDDPIPAPINSNEFKLKIPKGK